MVSSSCRTIYTHVCPKSLSEFLASEIIRHRLLTTTFCGSIEVIRLSSQYNHPPREEIQAVSNISVSRYSLEVDCRHLQWPLLNVP